MAAGPLDKEGITTGRMTGSIRFAILSGMLATLAGCSTMGERNSTESLDLIEAELRSYVEILASDDFGGRRPGTDGERKTLQYLAEKWEGAGLVTATNDPGNPWLAPIELTVRQPEDGSIVFARGKRQLEFEADEVRVFTTGRRSLLAETPIVFVGTQGAELGQSVLTGNVALMMWDHPNREDQRTALLENGAAAVIAIVLEPAEFAQRIRFRNAGTYGLAEEAAAATIDGYMSFSAASDLFGQGRIAALLKAAERPDFKPRELSVTASIEASSTGAALRTHNLIGKLPGKNPAAGAVLLMAHWDHFGTCGDPASGDTICNGAVDNASGLAMLTGLAVRLAKRGQLDRDVYFLATTAEEWGLLGAIDFTRNPPLPLESIVVAFNLDTVGVAGRGGEVAVIGAGLTSLDAEVDVVIARAGRVKATNDYAKMFVRRQDGWALLQRDVPTLMISSSFADQILFESYASEHYHRAGDNIDRVDFGGASEDLLLHIDLVEHFATLATHPTSGQ